MALFDRTSDPLKRARGGFAGFGTPPGDAAPASPAQAPGNAAQYGQMQPGQMQPGQVQQGQMQQGQLQPGSRDMRAQAVHRLQVGMFGLAAMLLLVSLASVIMQRVQTADRSAVAGEPTGGASLEPAKDPLVDLGVAPAVPVAGAAGGAGAQKPARTDPAHP